MNASLSVSLACSLLLASTLPTTVRADTPSGEEYGTSYPGAASGYEAPGTYSTPPATPSYGQPAPSGWSGQTGNGGANAYGGANAGYGGGSAYGASQGYGGAQAGGVQGGSFKGRGTPQGGGVGNPYSSGKTFTKPPKGNPGTQGIDASAFGGNGGSSSNSGWADPYAPTSPP